MSAHSALIGKTIIELQIATDRKALRFVLPDGEIVAQCDGDCCSSTWIENIELPALGFPAVVTAVEPIELPGGSPDNDGDSYIQVYGLKVTTDRGELIIDYRNESNGYYGGDLSWPGEYFYGGVYGQNVSTMEWEEVKP